MHTAITNYFNTLWISFNYELIIKFWRISKPLTTDNQFLLNETDFRAISDCMAAQRTYMQGTMIWDQ